MKREMPSGGHRSPTAFILWPFSPSKKSPLDPPSPWSWLGAYLASTILIHCMIQIPLNVPVASLLFRRVFGKSLGQSRFSIADQNTAIRKLHLLFSPLFADGIPTPSGPSSKRKYFSSACGPPGLTLPGCARQLLNRRSGSARLRSTASQSLLAALRNAKQFSLMRSRR